MKVNLPTESIKLSQGSSCRGRNGWFSPNLAEVCHWSREEKDRKLEGVYAAFWSLQGTRVGKNPACALELVTGDAAQLAYIMLHYAGVLEDRPALQNELKDLVTAFKWNDWLPFVIKERKDEDESAD